MEQALKFYLPNFEDLVDPEYDFLNDHPSSRRNYGNRFEHDWYVHDFFGDTPVFDGMLVSKTIIKEDKVRVAGGVHTFFRLKKHIPVMGDCGAFSYFNAERPPYQVEEILDYYQDLGFDQGVALDHLIFAYMDTAERERRFRLTIDNARAFIEQHEAKRCTFAPIGIAQGWDPTSRRQAVEILLAMGYRDLALGGMARSTNQEICASLEAIKAALPSDITLHVFGVARLSILSDFLRLGVTSADSASPIRRAFLGTSEDNYWTSDGTKYAAIRVPEAKKGSRSKRGINSTDEVIEKNGLSLSYMEAMEQRVLQLLRAYDRGKANLETTLTTVLEYDRLHGDQRDHEAAYRRTLIDRPWQSCNCVICQQSGVEVIIFRGNNRNRRRGFHNVKVFYEQFCQVTQSTAAPNKVESFQLPLI